MGQKSSAVVGRDGELRTLRELLESARDGQGAAIFLVGEGGIGKTRLAATAADLGFAADMRLLRGRGSAMGPPAPFRTLTEALLSLTRLDSPVDVAALGPYRPVLGRLIPDWGPPVAGDDDGSLVILAEAVLRLIGLAGRGNGCLVTIEDMHDADPETLAVVEYLADNIDRQPAVLLCTVRADDGPALALAQSAARRGAAMMVELGRLDRSDVRVLAASCLGVEHEDVPLDAADVLWAGSGGNPFLVEEVLGGMVDGGLLVAEEGQWRLRATARATAPQTFVRSVARRVESLDPRTRELVSAAAVLGRRFPLALMREVTGLSYRDLLSHLHTDRAAQLIVADDQAPGWYGFQHQLIVEALLKLLGAAGRSRLSARVADAVEIVYPGLPGEWCQTCATLRLDAGDVMAAGRLFLEAGRRALNQGAADSAVALLDRAWELLAHGGGALRADVLETLLYALAEAGQIDRALASVTALDEVGGGLDRQRRARLRTRLAWAAHVAGRYTDGLAQVDAARALLGADATAADSAPIDIVEAYLAVDQPGAEQLREAETLARRAATAAEPANLHVVACQAWQLLGALVRPRDPARASTCLERSRAIAVRHDLPIWEIHALARLGNDDAMNDGSLDRMRQARQKASRIGAVTARYHADASMSLQLVLRGEFDAAEALIDDVLGATTRLGLWDPARYVRLMRVVLAGHRGQGQELARALDDFFDHERGNQIQHAPRVHGLAKATCALLEEDRPRAVIELSTAVAYEARNPTIYAYAGKYGVQLLLRILAGEAGWDAYREITDDPASRFRWDRQFQAFGRAVLAGRSGRHAEAGEAVAEALAVGEPYAMGRHLGLRLVGEAALADGWGTPVDWLRMAEEYFHKADIPAVAGACRALMRGAGAKVAQRRSGAEEIPAALRAAGVTVREYEVLRLLVDRPGNREIADQLHLSPRTVERHISSLLTKTGLPNRKALGELAATVDQA
ncbi:LuxR family transcriptional regulator [Actinosynnema sp. ALI-1.44]|uniref:ATP-binding protein n=1 Tax=Actinosynnema sp. ALI-1.44 TaxID=1933779 RepID=UPI00097C6470|nr:LuxR family transcriptional regulator [Actinosynnema sp. ALI-1.44]ONI86937.1 LuxR family transcriptional regulator [Actinosynnema sp. ALI-1.44]